MKELDKNKAYDYSNLSESQLEELKAHMAKHHDYLPNTPLRHGNVIEVLFWNRDVYQWMYNPSMDTVLHNIVDARELFDQSLEEQLKEAEAKVEEIKNLIKQRDEPKIGAVCKFYDDFEDEFIISKLKRINEDSSFPYETIACINYKHFKKLTKDEVLKELGYE